MITRPEIVTICYKDKHNKNRSMKVQVVNKDDSKQILRDEVNKCRTPINTRRVKVYNCGPYEIYEIRYVNHTVRYMFV